MWSRLALRLRVFLYQATFGQPPTEKTEKSARGFVRGIRWFRRYAPPIVGIGTALGMAIGLPFYDVSIPLAAAVGLGLGVGGYLYIWFLLWILERWFVMEMEVTGVRIAEVPKPKRTTRVIYWLAWLALAAYSTVFYVSWGNYLLGAWGIVIAVLLCAWFVISSIFRWRRWRARRRQDS